LHGSFVIAVLSVLDKTARDLHNLSIERQKFFAWFRHVPEGIAGSALGCVPFIQNLIAEQEIIES